MHSLEKEAGERCYASIGLDVYVGNLPAIRLCAFLAYVQCGQFPLAKDTFACVEKSMERIEC